MSALQHTMPDPEKDLRDGLIDDLLKRHREFVSEVDSKIDVILGIETLLESLGIPFDRYTPKVRNIKEKEKQPDASFLIIEYLEDNGKPENISVLSNQFNRTIGDLRRAVTQEAKNSGRMVWLDKSGQVMDNDAPGPDKNIVGLRKWQV